MTRSACIIFKTCRKAKEPSERSSAHRGLGAKYSIKREARAVNVPSILYALPKVSSFTIKQNVKKKKILLRFLGAFRED